MLAVVFALPSEGEAAAKRVRKASVKSVNQKSTTPPIFAGGAGTEKKPYVIRTAAQLSAFAASVNSGNAHSGKYVKLGADIDLKDVVWIPIGIYSKGVPTRPFKGFFDGGGFIVYNMGSGNSIRPAPAFFGAADGATIQDVTLQSVEATGDSNVGGLVAFMARTMLKNCSVSGTVTGKSAVGGIVGSSLRGVMQNCSFSGNVAGDSGVGGLIGAADQSKMHLCGVMGSVVGDTDVGGFVGGILEGMILDCHANSVTIQGDRNVGGFIGNMIDNANVDKSTFKGQVVGNFSVGGIAGRMAVGELASCTVTGSIKGRASAGGVAGELIDGKINRCTSGASVDGITDIGGIVGRMSGGKLNDNANHGTIIGGEAVGGIVGSFSGGELDLSSNKSTGNVKGYSLTGPLIGTRAPK